MGEAFEQHSISHDGWFDPFGAFHVLIVMRNYRHSWGIERYDKTQKKGTKAYGI